MEKFSFPTDIKAFGVRVKNFPYGIKEAFDKLTEMLPAGDDRPYYGISECTNEGIIYKAAALQTFEGEAEKYGFETYTIEKGEYLAVTVMDWREKTSSIKNVFEDMFKDGRSDRTKPCIEIYKNGNEMACMVKIDERKEFQNEFENITKDLIELLSSFSQEQLDKIPFPCSWTAGQAAKHLVLSNSGFAQLLNGPEKETNRAPDEFVASIKESFLNFNIKMESPEFVRPPLTSYEKESLLTSMQNIKESIIMALQSADLTRTCIAFEIPVLGFLTKLEAINFVVSHTKRHIYQLKKIQQAVAEKEVEKTF